MDALEPNTNDGAVYDVWMSQQYRFEFRWCDLEASDFDQLLQVLFVSIRPFAIAS